MHAKKQKILIFAIWALILLIGVGVGFEWGKNYGTPKIQGASKIEQGAEDFVGEFKVVRVIDGDTIEIEGGKRVRYVGIDSPEMVEPGKPAECFGSEATKKNQELVEGQTVRLEKDQTDRDKYDRLLRYVWVGDTFINLELVKLGFARAATYPPDVKYQSQFSASQAQAKKSNLGLWPACKP